MSSLKWFFFFFNTNPNSCASPKDAHIRIRRLGLLEKAKTNDMQKREEKKKMSSIFETMGAESREDISPTIVRMTPLRRASLLIPPKRRASIEARIAASCILNLSLIQ
ncbi:hypothetical protein CEXT_475681 [Caerostris extrusa]|uniref:Uncharacterized protein n=1 Tax=Caerostris extrusa TaxID=172846 RepID=A0AAV4NBI6_CAEEX|nr:hypothetical protein CEXT_475681 [Caerostris extrusa]